jgi:hypothetical protein
MVRRVLPIIGRSLADLWDNILTLVAANAVWALAALPGMAVFLLGGSLLVAALAVVVLVLLLSPPTMGMFYLTADVTRRERLELRSFFAGIRQYYRRAWVVGAINGLFVILAYFNFIFYNAQASAGSPLAIIAVVWIYIVVVWFTMQIYMWPLALRMEQLKPWLLIRNSALATFKYAFFSLLLGLFLLVVLIASFFTAFLITVIVGTAFHTIVCNKALSVVLEVEQARANPSSEGGTASALALDVPPPLEKVQFQEKVESVQAPTVNTPPGVKRRGESITHAIKTEEKRRQK